MSNRLYLGQGTLTTIDGNLGTVRALHYGNNLGNPATHAFVALDMGVMLFATLGERLGERREWAEVDDYRVIDRDEFDRITGLDVTRVEMGWKL